MEKAIIGKKVGMTQIFDEAGKVIPVTVIEAGPCTVVQKKTEEKDGYNAVQLGYEDVAEKKLTKPELGHLKKAGEARKRTLKEFKLANCDALNVGDEVKVDVFAEGDRVDVTGISKGHGYQGVVKRHGAARDGARDQLSFGADVPDVRAETHHEPHRAEKKRRHLHGDFRPPAHGGERLNEEGAKRHQGILAEQSKEHGPRKNRQEKRRGGTRPAQRAGGLRPRRHLNGKIHAASSTFWFL